MARASAGSDAFKESCYIYVLSQGSLCSAECLLFVLVSFRSSKLCVLAGGRASKSVVQHIYIMGVYHHMAYFKPCPAQPDIAAPQMQAVIMAFSPFIPTLTHSNQFVFLQNLQLFEQCGSCPASYLKFFF